MRTLIILLFLALPAFPQMLQGIVGGKAPAAAPSFSITELGKTGPVSSQTTCALTTSGNVAAGHDVIAFVVGVASSAITCSASDGSADSYSNDLNFADSSQSYSRGCIVRATKSAQLNSGSTITVTSSASDNYSCVFFDVAGLTTAAVDQTQTNASYSASPVVTESNSLGQASELVVGAFVIANNGYPITATNGYTKISDLTMTARTSSILWKQVATTTAPSMTGTVSGAQSYGGFMATYKIQ